MKKINILFALLVLSVLGFGFVRSYNQPIVANAEKTGINIGDVAPDIKLNNPEGKEMSLYALRGNMVLVDFWASWCGPCRMENPYVVKAYNTYSKKAIKDAKGFTIFSVSLDSNPEAWKAAITRDQLTWPDHVSDLKQWRSVVVPTFDIHGIPFNFLVDAKGVIVAKNLRGPALEEELAKWAK